MSGNEHDTAGEEGLTTGQVARIMKARPRDVSSWFDRGLLTGTVVEGNRRIDAGSVERLMRRMAAARRLDLVSAGKLFAEGELPIRSHRDNKARELYLRSLEGTGRSQ